jgi:plastocyanin
MTVIRRCLAIGLLLTTMTACGGGSESATPGTATSSAVVGGDPVPFTITAQDIKFSPASLTVPAGHPLDVTLDNKDSGVPHSLVLQAGPNGATNLFESEVITGPATLGVTIPGLVPGVYQFSCKVHPNMTMALTVEP